MKKDNLNRLKPLQKSMITFEEYIKNQKSSVNTHHCLTPFKSLILIDVSSTNNISTALQTLVSNKRTKINLENNNKELHVWRLNDHGGNSSFNDITSYSLKESYG